MVPSSSRAAVQPGYWQCPPERLCSARCCAKDAQRPTRECTRSRPCGLIVRRRASQTSRSAVSGLRGPAPSSSGGSSRLTCTISVVGLRFTPPPCAAAPGERDERVRGRLLPLEDRSRPACRRALGLCDVPDCLLEGGALLERQTTTEHELAPARRPGHAQRATLDTAPDRPRPWAGRACGRPRNLTGCLADRDAHELGFGLRCRVLGGGCDLVERQRSRAERVVECGQAAQRLPVRGDTHGRAVVAAARPVPATGRSTSTPPPANHRALRPRARSASSAAAGAPRARRSTAAHAAAPRGDAPAPDRPFPPIWRTYVRIIQSCDSQSVRDCAEMQRFCDLSRQTPYSFLVRLRPHGRVRGLPATAPPKSDAPPTALRAASRPPRSRPGT